MTEIRTIREEEAETFLRLLCETFGVEFNRAYRAFFEEPYFDLDRKWALFEGQEMVSVVTTTPLLFGWGNGVGIAGVSTRKDRRQEGHAGRLIERVLRESDRRGEGPALLFAQREELYLRYGFEPLDRVIRAALPEVRSPELENEVPFVWVRAQYDAWAEGHADRLRRDDRRWSFWNWNFRQAGTAGDGYVCHEHGTLREAIGVLPGEALPVPEGTEWYGTTLMADALGLVFETATIDLVLMGRNIPGVPQMFLTDQF